MPVDQKTFFTALGFMAVVLRGGQVSSDAAADKAKQLASLIEIFCAENSQADTADI